MKKIWLVFSLLLTFCLSVPSGLFATEYTLTDTTVFTASGTDAAEDLDAYGWGDVNKLDGSGDYVKWTHHYTFEPEAESLISATLTISLWDDEKDKWYNPFTWEIGAGIAESWQFTIGDVDSGEYTYSINVAYLADGSFTVKVASALGDFYITSSTLSITYNAVDSSTDSAPVPEPATLMLLGSGLLGLASLRRKKQL